MKMQDKDDINHCDNCKKEVSDGEDCCDECYQEGVRQKMEDTRHPDDRGGKDV